jgi:hypothetical protein
MENLQNVSSPVARNTMTELKAVGLVDYTREFSETEEKEIELNYKFNWFLRKDFADLREKFKPEDYSEYLKNKKGDNSQNNLKGNLPPHTHEVQNREDMEKAIELAATESTDSVRYTCPLCNVDQFKTQKEHHKKSCKAFN